MAQAADEDVNQFMVITGGGIPRETALRFIQDAQNNIEHAINNYFENPARYESIGNTSWEEGVFTQGRNGEDDGLQPPAFSIQGDDVLGPATSSVTPTRPPSRVDQHQQNIMGMNSMEASQQESGVIRSAYFGPATREEYNLNHWALTLAQPTAQEVYPDFDHPADRMRVPGEPAFLKPSPANEFLPSLLTILSTIPLAQQALLLQDVALANTEHNPDWWQGGAIRSSQIIQSGETPDYSTEVVNETQRLTAFLIGTQRKYGTVEGLVESINRLSSNDAGNSNSSERFLSAWSAAVPKLLPDLESAVLELFYSELKTNGMGEELTMRKPLLEITLDKQTSGPTKTIYDAFDSLIWGSDPNGSAPSAPWLSHSADVLIISITQPDSSISGLNMQILPIWYSDRYLSSNAAAAQEMRRAVDECRVQFNEIEQQKSNIFAYPLPGTNKPVNGLELLAKLIETFSDDNTVQKQELSEDPDDASYLDDEYSTGADVLDIALVQRLKSVYDELKSQIRALEEEQAGLNLKMNQLSNFLKDTSNGNSPSKCYKLRGVATSLSTTYLLQSSSLGDSSSSEIDVDREQEQWWKIVYTSEPQVDISKTTEDTVLKAAQMESRKALLVYATEDALSVNTGVHSDSLNNFVLYDNASFEAELSKSNRKPPYFHAPDWERSGKEESSPPNSQEWKAEPGGSYASWQGGEGSANHDGSETVDPKDVVMANTGLGTERIEFAN